LRRPTTEEIRANAGWAKAAKPSEYLRHLAEVAASLVGKPIYLLVRESTESQRDHMPAQVEFCERVLKSFGLRPTKVFRVIGTANGDEARAALEAAGALAKPTGGSVVAESTSRLIRSGNYNSRTNRNALPSDLEFAELIRVSQSVPLVTIHPPDLSEKEESRCQTRRGMIPKDRRGGRPHKKPPGYKKEQRLKDEPRAIALWQSRMSLGEISSEICRAKSTIEYWVEQHRTNFRKSSRPGNVRGT